MPERVPAAVPPLVVGLGDLGRHLEQRRRVAGEDPVAHARVGLHHLELLDRQRAGSCEHGVGHGDLADVVEASRQTELLAPFGVLAEGVGDLGRHVADALGVLAGLGVAELGEHRQLLERVELVRPAERSVARRW